MKEMQKIKKEYFKNKSVVDFNDVEWLNMMNKWFGIVEELVEWGELKDYLKNIKDEMKNFEVLEYKFGPIIEKTKDMIINRVNSLLKEITENIIWVIDSELFWFDEKEKRGIIEIKKEKCEKCCENCNKEYEKCNKVQHYFKNSPTLSWIYNGKEKMFIEKLFKDFFIEKKKNVKNGKEKQGVVSDILCDNNKIHKIEQEFGKLWNIYAFIDLFKGEKRVEHYQDFVKEFRKYFKEKYQENVFWPNFYFFETGGDAAVKKYFFNNDEHYKWFKTEGSERWIDFFKDNEEKEWIKTFRENYNSFRNWPNFLKNEEKTIVGLIFEDVKKEVEKNRK